MTKQRATDRFVLTLLGLVCLGLTGCEIKEFRYELYANRATFYQIRRVEGCLAIRVEDGGRQMDIHKASRVCPPDAHCIVGPRIEGEMPVQRSGGLTETKPFRVNTGTYGFWVRNDGSKFQRGKVQVVWGKDVCE